MNVLTKTIQNSLIITVLILFSCNNNSESNQENDKIITQQNVNSNSNIDIELDIKTLDKNNIEFVIGDEIIFLIEQKDTNQLDSVQFFINNTFLETSNSLPTKVKWSSRKSKTGKNNFEARAFHKENKDTWKLSLTLISDIEPQESTFEIINTFTHDRAAYTQGLVYEDDYLFEATGLRGQSTLRKVQLATGDVVLSFTLPTEIFGEGITIFHDKIIQLSYQSYTGFVFDKKTFSMLSKFNYPKPTEGWGLTHDGTNLIMSDGTQNLYFIDPVSYSQTGKLEVYDNNGPVKKLNELEFINGQLWANIYTTDRIAIIDPETGKVLNYIDLTDILPQKDYERDTDVLNGIAYDNKNNRIFVTGKKWPKLFEIKIKNK